MSTSPSSSYVSRRPTSPESAPSGPRCSTSASTSWRAGSSVCAQQRTLLTRRRAAPSSTSALPTLRLSMRPPPPSGPRACRAAMPSFGTIIRHLSRAGQQRSPKLLLRAPACGSVEGNARLLAHTPPRARMSPAHPLPPGRLVAAPGLRARPCRPVTPSSTISLGNSAYAGFCATRWRRVARAQHGPTERETPAARRPRVAYTGHVAGPREPRAGHDLHPARMEEGPWTHRRPETPAHGRAAPGT